MADITLDAGGLIALDRTDRRVMVLPPAPSRRTAASRGRPAQDRELSAQQSCRNRRGAFLG
jgi:hypothetical protein